jgi:hypothetical protein
MTSWPQHPNDIEAGRTANWALTSIRKRRGNDLAASELATPPHTITATTTMSTDAARPLTRATGGTPTDITPLIAGDSGAE